MHLYFLQLFWKTVMRKIVSNLVVAASVSSLIGCGGSGDDDSANAGSGSVDTVSVSEPDPGTEIEEPGSQVPDNVVVTDTFGPPQFIQAECPSALISGLSANNTTATPFTLNEVVRGQLIDGSTVLNFDLWQITLEPGNYHLITDSVTVSGELESVGVSIDSVTGEGDERLLFSVDNDFDTRGYEFLEIVNTETLTLRVEPVFNEALNYELAIYANGAAVPTPRFTRCPPATTISLGETQALEISNLTSIDDYRWFRMNLPAGVYTLDAAAPGVQGETFAYTFDLFQRFGDADLESQIGFDVAAGDDLSNSFQFTVLDNNDIWIRVRASNDRNIEFTVNQ